MTTAAMTNRIATIIGSISEGRRTDTSLLLSPPLSLNAGGEQLAGSTAGGVVCGVEDGTTIGGSESVPFSACCDDSAHFRLVWWKNAFDGQSGSG